jgi:hypothetical protein
VSIDEDDPRPVEIREYIGALQRFTGFVSRGRRSRAGRIQHQRAEIGVFPLLDAPVRQALFHERVKRRGADVAHRVVAGERREMPRQRLFGFRPDAGRQLRHQAASLR